MTTVKTYTALIVVLAIVANLLFLGVGWMMQSQIMVANWYLLLTAFSCTLPTYWSLKTVMRRGE